jgi:hypothetical protein
MRCWRGRTANPDRTVKSYCGDHLRRCALACAPHLHQQTPVLGSPAPCIWSSSLRFSPPCPRVWMAGDLAETICGVARSPALLIYTSKLRRSARPRLASGLPRYAFHRPVPASGWPGASAQADVKLPRRAICFVAGAAALLMYLRTLRCSPSPRGAPRPPRDALRHPAPCFEHAIHPPRCGRGRAAHVPVYAALPAFPARSTLAFLATRSVSLPRSGNAGSSASLRERSSAG